MFSSSETVGKEATSAFGKEIKDEAERFKAIYFIIRADEKIFKKLHDNLKYQRIEVGMSILKL